MNRFRSRKKGKDAVDISDAPPVPSFSAKSFRKTKKKQVEKPVEIDLVNALPSTDDFRTSLLMPNLSARFSMLREQDDPNSKIGKANDDSVLFPKRASRLNLFGHPQLSDIAEVSSLHGSTRPSLNLGRGSYTSADTDEDFSPTSSVMNRSRPVEGNNLFGGRQKVYKIPTSRSGSASEAGGIVGGSGSGGGRMGGKAMYESDVIRSTFHPPKDNHSDNEGPLDVSPEPSSNNTRTDATGLAISPSVSWIVDKRTSTSTTSGNSQGPTSRQGSVNGNSTTSDRQNQGTIERNPTKSRRLYDHSLETRTQSSALNRLESLNRQRSVANDLSNINRTFSKSAVSLNDRFQKKAPVYASSTFRPTSPPPSSTSSVVGSTDGTKKAVTTPNGLGLTSPHGFGIVSPLSPPVSEGEEGSALAAAVQPEDRGKATATGLFNKPASRYDDNQFSQRQIQIHEGRNTPPLRRPSPSRNYSGHREPSRSRGASTTSHQSKQDSFRSRSPRNRSRATTPHTEDRCLPTNDDGAGVSSPLAPPPLSTANNTFLANLSETDSGSDGEGEVSKSKTSSMSHTHDGVHSSLRTSMESRDSMNSISASKLSQSVTASEIRYSDGRDLNTINEDEMTEPTPVVVEPPTKQKSDSPTLGPSGLSGLIRTHLRQDSDRSAILPAPSPKPASDNLEENGQKFNLHLQESRAANHAASIHSNPWEYDDWGKASSQPVDGPESLKPRQPDFSSMSLRAKQILGQATALSNQGQDHNSQRSNREDIQMPPPRPVTAAPAPPAPPAPTWQDELKSGHHRAGSSETQMEREEFANELAERRRKVQEKLKSFAETESRSSSPTGLNRFAEGYHNQSPGKPGNAFAMLKSKASRTHGPAKQELAHFKNSRLLGMDKPAFNSSAPNLRTNDMLREEEERMRREFRQKSRAESPNIGSSRNNHHWGQQPHQHPQSAPFPRHSEDGPGESVIRDSHSSSWKSTSRDRSGSDTSGRSKSRPRHREDLGAVRESHEQSRPPRPSVDDKTYRNPSSLASSAKPSLEILDDRYGASERSTPSSATTRFRSNSRAAAPLHIDLKNLNMGPSPHAPFMSNSPRPSPSPMTPYSANATPPLFETSPATTPALGGPVLDPLATHGRPSNLNDITNISTTKAPQSLGSHRRAIDKSQISEPKFISTTSNVPTVGLPPGASLSNGTPPIPPMNPRRRRQTTTQTILGAFKSSSSERSEVPPPSNGSSSHLPEEHSTFSDEEKQPRPRQRLRKISSEGGSLNAKARQQQMTNSSTPALPHYPKQGPSVEGGMF
ncbi:hypothetical protein FQN57_007171 [Myotisia sp. PD_48]|nr:hypothetical protein FQN57_007171 [Myotisia sp. PD_48]